MEQADRNGNVYNKEGLKTAIDEYLENMKTKRSFQTMKVDSLVMEGSNLIGHFTIMPDSKEMAALLEGCQNNFAVSGHGQIDPESKEVSEFEFRSFSMVNKAE